MKTRVFSLLKHYCVEPPYEILSDILWKCKLEEFSQIKTKAVREHYTKKYFLNKLAEFNDCIFQEKRIAIDTGTVLYYFTSITLHKMDYGDAVYNELKQRLYNRYGV